MADQRPPSAACPPPPPNTVSHDFVKILVAARNAHGLHYAPVAVTSNFTVAGPGLFPSGFMNAIYKVMFDARRKLRAALAANGYLPDDSARGS